MKKIFLLTFLILFNSNVLSAENIEIISDTKGDGLKVVNHSWVKIEYTGFFEDGKIFDTNVGKDKPLVFQIGMKELKLLLLTKIDVLNLLITYIKTMKDLFILLYWKEV